MQHNLNHDEIYKLETNLDDCTGEALGFVMKELLEAGARDVYYIPVFMKKNRPGYELCVLCTERDIWKMQEIIFANTTTIGIRYMKMDRMLLKRRPEVLQTPLGEIEAKVCKVGDKERIYPEFESLAKFCDEWEISYQEALEYFQAAREAAKRDDD